jgi:hypothetical protein
VGPSPDQIIQIARSPAPRVRSQVKLRPIPIHRHMASSVKAPKGKRLRDSHPLPKGAESETQPSPSKKGRLGDRSIDPQELQATEHPTESSPKKKTKKHVLPPQTPPQHIADAPKTPGTRAAAEQLGLESGLAKQLLKTGGGLSSLTSMIMEAGKMMVDKGMPDTDAKYKSMLAELVTIMVTFPFSCHS